MAHLKNQQELADDIVQIVSETIDTMIGPTGGWLDSPESVKAQIVDAIRKKYPDGRRKK